MRVVGKHRKGKVEGPRVVGFGLMVAGSMALVLSVAGAAGAGSGSTKAAEPAHHTCSVVHKEDGPIAQVLQWQGSTNCQQNTTTTHKKYPCVCSTTTTEVVTTTSEQVAGTMITLATTTTEVPTTTTEAPTTTTEETTTTVNGLVGGTTTTEITVPPGVVPQGGTSTTLYTPGPGDTAGPVGQQITVSPETATLPFTGSNTMPLAGAGIVMVLAGFGLSRRKRSLAN